MFYFETLLNQGLAGIDHTAILGTITGIAYAILLVGFLLGLYQAALRGGDLQSFGITAIKYVVVAIIVANWSTAFREINSSMTQVAHSIYSRSNGADVFMGWLDQLKQQFDADGTTAFLHLVNNSTSALITVVLVFVAYLIYVLAIVIFGFFYTLFGCVLYVLGPLVLALLPMPGASPLAKAFATNIFLWNGWAILYATFEALITAIQANRVNDMFTFLGFFRGGLDSTMLGLVSIFYALALLLIPFIAKTIVSGDVGSAAFALVRSAVVAAGAAISAGAGFAAGYGQASGAPTASGGSGATGGGTSSSTASTSSSAPPREPSLGNTIREGMASALSGDSPRPRGSNGGNAKSGGGGKGGGKNGGSSGSSGAGARTQSSPAFRPVGMGQTLAYHAGRFAGGAAREIRKAASKQTSSNGNGNGDGKET